MVTMSAKCSGWTVRHVPDIQQFMEYNTWCCNWIPKSTCLLIQNMS